MSSHDFALKSPEIAVGKNISSKHGIRLQAQCRQVLLKANINASRVSVAANNSKVCIDPTANIVTNNFHSDSKTTEINGSITDLRSAHVLRLQMTGDLHVGVNGKIGKLVKQVQTSNVKSKNIQLVVDGNITNFGTIASVKKLHLSCNNLIRKFSIISNGAETKNNMQTHFVMFFTVFNS